MTTSLLIQAEEAASLALQALPRVATIPRRHLLPDYERAGLSKLKATAEVQDRVDAISRCGLMRVNIEQAVEMLFRDARSIDPRFPVKVERSFRRGVSQWEDSKGDWGHRVPTDVYEASVTGAESMLFRTGAVGDIALALPRGVALRIAETKESGLFDEVCAIAPFDAFVTQVQVGDPVVLGMVCRRNREKTWFAPQKPDEKPFQVEVDVVSTDPTAMFVLALWR